MTSGGNKFNHFPANQLNKFRANTTELIPKPGFPRNKSALWLCVPSLSTSISTHLKYLLRSNEIQVCFSLFSRRGTEHVKLTTKSSQITSVWRHFYALRESWLVSQEDRIYNSLGGSSKINRAVTMFNFNRRIADSPIQITIHEIRHFTLMTEQLTFTTYFAFRCKPIWGNASVSRYYRSPCPDIFWGTASPKNI